jgi:hypothetical protein
MNWLKRKLKRELLVHGIIFLLAWGCVTTVALVMFLASAHAQNYVAPTPPAGDNSNNIATTAFVQGAIGGAGGGGGGLLPALTTGFIWVGDPTNMATGVALTGDCTLSPAGVITCSGGGGGTFGPLATAPLPVTVPQGGTGFTTLPANGVLLGEGTGPVGTAPIGTVGRVLVDQGAGADPSFNVLSGDVSAVTAGGALTIGKVNGTSFPAVPTIHQTPVVTSPNTATWKTLPNCLDAGGNHLNYAQSTDLFSCGSSNNAAAAIPNYLTGMLLANDIATPNTTLDITAGSASDSLNATTITLPGFTKLVSTQGATTCTNTWVAGTGNCGMIATVTANTWYHVFAIINAGNPDIYFDTNIAAANAPAATTAFRRIGSIKVDAGGNILAFVQHYDEFSWVTPVLDVNGVTISGTTALETLASIPPNVSTKASMNVRWSTGSTLGRIYVMAPDVAAQVPQDLVAPLATDNLNVSANFVRGFAWSVWSNASQQVRVGIATGVSANVSIATLGWRDTLGR